MIFITGGSYSGKTDFAKSRFGFSDSDILDGEYCSEDELMTAECVKNYHLFVKRIINEKSSSLNFIEKLYSVNSGIVIIMDEIGAGIIPLDKSDRIWREETGRTGCKISELSEKVIRLVCGVPVVIKEK